LRVISDNRMIALHLILRTTCSAETLLAGGNTFWHNSDMYLHRALTDSAGVVTHFLSSKNQSMQIQSFYE